SRAARLFGEGFVDEAALLEVVACFAARRRARGGWARDDGEWQALADDAREVRVEEVPRAHVARLFLDPYETGAVGVVGETLLQLFVDGIELLEAHDRDVATTELSARVEEIVVDLAAAQEDALHFARVGVAIGDDALELALREVVDRRGR